MRVSTSAKRREKEENKLVYHVASTVAVAGTVA